MRDECGKQFQDFINGLEERLNPTSIPTLDAAEIWKHSSKDSTDQEMTALKGKKIKDITFNGL